MEGEAAIHHKRFYYPLGSNLYVTTHEKKARRGRGGEKMVCFRRYYYYPTKVKSRTLLTLDRAQFRHLASVIKNIVIELFVQTRPTTTTTVQPATATVIGSGGGSYGTMAAAAGTAGALPTTIAQQ